MYSLNDYFYGYELRISRLPQKQDRLQYILEKELYPVLKNVELDIEYEALVNLVQQQLVQFKGGNLVVEAAKLAQVQSCLAKYKLWKNAPQPDCSKIKNLHLNVDELTGNLLVRDTVRADLTAYDKMQLEDPNRGSWELWDALHDETENKVEVGRYFYARDPRTDILEGGLVGIDFGTKSTVVAIKGDTETITPIRVGSGQLDAAVKAKHYENPTVMEFIDIESFMQAYASREGRPLTSWADITTSHTAFEDWNNIDKTENYFAFFGELKQWAGDSSRNIRIRDKKKKEILLPPYAELHEGDFDPIEIYAYYIGLYINNMHRGKIFMEYLLSFPVTYTLDVRKRILNSFQRGLRRSLPQAIVQDEQCMQKFHVEQGVGEPAAYAVCALQEYHLRPQNDEKIAYAVFDFGGGTTDFDFGIWRKAKGPKERRFNYVIEHFGDGGDKYLGGENLLELLAFEVFKANADALRKTGISFFCPPECKEFSGSEVLLSNSQEARSNMRSLMEKLRPFWEGRAVETDAYTNRRDTSEAQKQEPTYFKEGQIKLSLFKNDGSVAENFSLRTDEAKLKKILEQRIYQGVDAFFDALIKNSSKYAAALGEDEQRQGISKINVFLAGNSSKSLILKAVFQKLITKYQNEISKRIAQKDMKEFIELFPPLGTEEAAAKLKELKVSEELQGVERPTAKTGVAIGLVKCRPGSKIKVINERKADEEIKFSCFLGDKDEDGYFAALMTSEQQYNVWIPYWDAGDASFEFYYTKSATAGRSKGLRVENNTMVKNCHLRLPQEAVNEDWTIYLRAVAPATIEYTVAADDEALKREEFKFSPLKVKLEY
ncbi:molecular chaperone DnaK [Phascolarctobacterium succinatutens]|uniref:molecular chaperone DnaK n=1 Tax=Phascolarctobacterium succinatutens TaxID=626940 RepID=UPI0039F4A9C8